MTSTRSSFHQPTKRDTTALAFLIAMGFALAMTAGASLTAAGTGKLVEVVQALGFGRTTAIEMEQHRQAAGAAKLEDTLRVVIEEIEAVKQRDAVAHADPAVAIHLATLDSELALIKTETAALRAAQGETLVVGAVSRGLIDDIKADLAHGELVTGELRSSLDDRDRSQQAAMADIGNRVDRLEHLVAVGEPTGSVGPAASPKRHRDRPRLSGWSVQSGWSMVNAQDGRAVLAGQSGTFEVAPGTFVPGLGRVAAVRHHAGHWIVVTDQGTVTQR